MKTTETKDLTLADWQTVRGKLRGLLAADPDGVFRADEQAMRPRTGTRLPGVRRFSNGKTQRLLYLNPEAVRPTAEKPHDSPALAPEPRETPCKREEREPINHAAKGEERATGRICALPCDCAPLPPTMPTDDAPLDELLAAMDVLEAWASGVVGVGTPEGGRPDFRPWGEITSVLRVPTMEHKMHDLQWIGTKTGH